MFSRALEILVVALLILVAASALLQFRTQELLKDIKAVQNKVQTDQAALLAVGPRPAPQTNPQPTPAPIQPAPVSPGPEVTQVQNPDPAPAPLPTKGPETAPAPEPTPAPTAQTPRPSTTPATVPATVAVKPAPAPTPAPTPVPKAPAPTPAQALEDEAWKDLGPMVTQIVEELLKGEYNNVAKRFNETLAKELGVAKLAAPMDEVRNEHGTLKKILGHQSLPKEDPNGALSFTVDVELTDGHRMRFTLTIEEDRKISGLFMNDLESIADLGLPLPTP